MNNNNNGYGRGSIFGGPKVGPLGLIAKGVAQGIGLASEGIHAHKEKKAAEKAAAAAAAAAAEDGRHSQSHSPAPCPPGQSDSMGRPQGSRHASEKSAHSSLAPQPSYDAPPSYEEDEKRQLRPELQESHSSHHSEKSEKAENLGAQERELEEGDEEQWDLDDAQDQLAQSEASGLKQRKFVKNPRTTVQSFIDDYPLPPGYQPHGRLSLPVVLPQRRPKDRLRGFIRAYAPELMNNDIDQDMFLDFLETLYLASQPSPWINAINMAGFATIPLPFLAGQAISIAIMLTVSLMKNMDSRKRCNTVLDQFNEQFFQPRGLYCMILTWAPETDAMEVGININETIHQNLAPPAGLAKVVHNFRPSMGRTSGVAFTETAPLVFPTLDKLDDNKSAEAKSTKAKLKSAISFTSEYYDRRAQAKFAAEAAMSGSGSQLVVGPKPTFTSRYSDPNNPTNSGSILALLTGGKLYLPTGGRGSRGGYGYGDTGGMGVQYDRFGRPIGGFGRRRRRGGPLGMLGMLVQQGMEGNQPKRQEQQMMLEQEQMMMNQKQYEHGAGTTGLDPKSNGKKQDVEEYEERSYHQYEQQMPNQQQQMQGSMYSPQMQNQMMYGQQIGRMGPGVHSINPVALLGNGVRRILSHHVLYLLITNMPTEEEMADATKFMEQVREAQKHPQSS